MTPTYVTERVHGGQVAFLSRRLVVVLGDEFEGHPIHGDYFRVERFADSAWILGYGI
jgi:hypothetical protein